MHKNISGYDEVIGGIMVMYNLFFMLFCKCFHIFSGDTCNFFFLFFKTRRIVIFLDIIHIT